MSSENSDEDAARGYKIVRSYSSSFHMPAKGCDGSGMMSIQLTMALLTINAGCKRYIAKIDNSELEDLYKTPQGHITKYGDGATNRSKVYELDTSEKCGEPDRIEEIRVLKTKLCQASRLAIAWWTDPEELRKTVRIFGDRILLTVPHVVVPQLFSFGLSIYNLVYPESEAHPDHCSKCKKRLSVAQWHGKSGTFLVPNDEIGVHLENPPRFLCQSCKYLHDTGFRPGSIRKRKNQNK